MIPPAATKSGRSPTMPMARPSGGHPAPTTGAGEAPDRLGKTEDREPEDDEHRAAPRELGVIGDEPHPCPGRDAEDEPTEGSHHDHAAPASCRPPREQRPPCERGHEPPARSPGRPDRPRRTRRGGRGGTPGAAGPAATMRRPADECRRVATPSSAVASINARNRPADVANEVLVVGVASCARSSCGRAGSRRRTPSATGLPSPRPAA